MNPIDLLLSARSADDLRRRLGYTLATDDRGGRDDIPDPPRITSSDVEADIDRVMKALDREQGALAKLIKADLAAALESPSPSELVRALRTALDRHRPALVALLAHAHAAAALTGLDRLSEGLEPPPPDGLPVPEVAIGSHPGDPHGPALPLIQEAARRLRQPDVERVLEDANRQGERRADAEVERAEQAMREALAVVVEEGGTLQAYRRAIGQALGESFLSERHAETVFRTNVMEAYSRAQLELVREDPDVAELYPYAAYHATHDDRVRPEHLAMETYGLDGTNIYRVDDPTFQAFRPPFSWQCRCVWSPCSVEQAARAGVREAQEWLRTGVPPATPARVTPPPFRPPAEYVRELGFDLAWEADQNYKGKSRKWIGVGDDAGKKPRYQMTQPGAGRRPAAGQPAEKKPARKPAERKAKSDPVEATRSVLGRLVGAAEEPTDQDANDLVAALGKMTLAQLADMKKAGGLKVKGRKAEQVAAIARKLLDEVRASRPRKDDAAERRDAEKPTEKPTERPTGTPEGDLKTLLSMDSAKDAAEFIASKTDDQLASMIVASGDGRINADTAKMYGREWMIRALEDHHYFAGEDRQKKKAQKQVVEAVAKDQKSHDLVAKLAGAGAQAKAALSEHRKKLADAMNRAGNAKTKAQRRAAMEEYNTLSASFGEVEQAAMNARAQGADAAKKILAAEKPSKIAVNHDQGVPEETRKQVEEGASWLGAILHESNQEIGSDVASRRGSERSYYDPQTQTVHLGSGAGVDVAVHEICHQIERMPGIKEAVHAFLEYRCGDEPYVKMNDVSGGGYEDGEMGRKDDFEKVFGKQAYYVGKTYSTGNTELLSMGVQALYNDPAGLAEKDPELCAFLIGILHGRIRG